MKHHGVALRRPRKTWGSVPLPPTALIRRDRMERDSGSSEVEVRRATADDAQAIGAVFDAAVRAGWTYLGEPAQKPMFAPQDWDQLVAGHGPPKVLLVATGRAGQVVGYTAAHPDDGEMFLLFVHPAYAGRGIGRTLLGAAHDALRAAGCRQAYLYPHDGSVRESDFGGTTIRELRLVKQL